MWVRNYRSLRSVDIAPSGLTVIVGSNGSGKSNLYKALGLIAEAAQGRLAQAMLAEGGMPSALFAGERQAGPVRMTLGAQLEDYRYELELGLRRRLRLTVPARPGREVRADLDRNEADAPDAAVCRRT